MDINRFIVKNFYPKVGRLNTAARLKSTLNNLNLFLNFPRTLLESNLSNQGNGVNLTWLQKATAQADRQFVQLPIITLLVLSLLQQQ